MKLPRRLTISDQELDRKLATSYRRVSQATAADEQQVQGELDAIAARAAVLEDSRCDHGVPVPAKLITTHVKAGRSIGMERLLVMILISASNAVMSFGLHGSSGQAILSFLVGCAATFFAVQLVQELGAIRERGAVRKKPAESEDRFTST
ncbi:hypothetical protein ACFQVD_30335 [Streptosporangium amethystogenes subsp. fukuiense]|uniref:Uncharacterized protein n=1 Tax=Streptosporangium amethystogenes subsp. fukuiense TaxID=698418 RepID=A0ABW2T6Y5_9ACTN